jgi:hypothetical protein
MSYPGGRDRVRGGRARRLVVAHMRGRLGNLAAQGGCDTSWQGAEMPGR